MRIRTSPIWDLPKEEFESLVAKSETFTAILAHVGLRNIGHNWKTLRTRLLEDGIDFSHIGTGRTWAKGKFFRRASNEEVFVKGPGYGKSHIKERIIKENLLSYICANCKLEPVWNGEKLVLHLDHINGDGTDDRLENLRFLCPNCHSQTKTYTGRNKILGRHVPKYCIDCNKQVSHNQYDRCFLCSQKWRGLTQRKFDPSKEELENLVKSNSIIDIGLMFNVSEAAVRKRCELLGILYKKKDLKMRL